MSQGSETRIRRDNRKAYPTGTRGSAGIDAYTDEPQTKNRGEQFQQILGDTLLEARALVEERLRAAGFADLEVTITDADLKYWWPASVMKEEDLWA